MRRPPRGRRPGRPGPRADDERSDRGIDIGLSTVRRRAVGSNRPGDPSGSSGLVGASRAAAASRPAQVGLACSGTSAARLRAHRLLERSARSTPRRSLGPSPIGGAGRDVVSRVPPSTGLEHVRDHEERQARVRHRRPDRQVVRGRQSRISSTVASRPWTQWLSSRHHAARPASPVCDDLGHACLPAVRPARWATSRTPRRPAAAPAAVASTDEHRVGRTDDHPRPRVLRLPGRLEVADPGGDLADVLVGLRDGDAARPRRDRRGPSPRRRPPSRARRRRGRGPTTSFLSRRWTTIDVAAQPAPRGRPPAGG